MKNDLFMDTAQPHEGPAFKSLCHDLGISFNAGWPDVFGRKAQAWSATRPIKKIRTISLFSGAGGLDIGFHDMGFDIQTMIEIDERFAATLSANTGKSKYFEDSKILCQDIRDYSPSKGLKVDFIIGGPPCQTFSAAGRRAAGVPGTTHATGRLFEEYVRLLKTLRPTGFLFENVYGITGAEGGRAWELITQAFMKAGYSIHWRVLDSADYGVPQHRERVFIIGTKIGKEFLFPRPTHGPDSPGQLPYYTAGQAIRAVKLTHEDRNRKVGGRYGELLKEIPPGLNYSYFTEKMGHPRPLFAWRSKFSDFLYKADPNCPVRTLKAQVGAYAGPFHWEGRPFSITELKRLQTFPDRYKVVGKWPVAMHQIGNSVPPQIARVLAKEVLKQVFGIKGQYEWPTLRSDQKLGFRKRKRRLTQVYKDKAGEGIKLIKPNRSVENMRRQQSRSYYAMVTSNFKLIVSPEHQENYLPVTLNTNGKSWTIEVKNPLAISQQSRFEILIKPRTPDRWSFPSETIRLIGGELNEVIFTTLWKVLDFEIRTRSIKVDLVQLIGYYQYDPLFVCEMRSSGPSSSWEPMWKILEKVVSGLGVGKILEISDLAILWGISARRVQDYAQKLKQMGYEIRNSNTNGQIPPGCYLIPYPFPSLTHMSVQLHKKLELQNA